jgi:N-acetylmuramoyl-L-alanine amidase
MSRLFRLLPLALGFAFLPLVEAQGSAPAGKVGVSRDEWGHRPGPRGFSTVILDAGHGGLDSGTRSGTTGQYEKDLTLTMVKLIRLQLAKSVRCVLIRNSDIDCDLDRRVDFVNSFGDAILVSIHFNSGPSNVAGPEVFYWRVDSYTLAKRIQRSLKEAVPGRLSSRGLVRRRLRLTRNPRVPSVLVECGYLSNPREARLIRKPGYRADLARAIARAILQQRKEGDGNLGPLPPPLYEPPSRRTDPRE